MSLPVCVDIPEIPDPFAIPLPGGIEIERINLMEVIQPALTPLMPVFNIVDTITAIKNCIEAVPNIVTDPTAMNTCIEGLGEAIEKLMGLMPQTSLPLLVVRLIELVIYTLRDARGSLVHLQHQLEQITRLIDRAKELDDAGMSAIAACSQGNVEQEAANVGKMLASLGRLIGLINLFSGMIGGPEIPDLSDLAGVPLDEVITPLDALIDTLQTARDAVPVP